MLMVSDRISDKGYLFVQTRVTLKVGSNKHVIYKIRQNICIIIEKNLVFQLFKIWPTNQVRTGLFLPDYGEA